MYYTLDEIRGADLRQLRSMYLTLSAEIRDLQEELRTIDKALHEAADIEEEDF